MRSLLDASLQVAHGASADTGTLGQCLLGQGSGDPMLPEEVCKLNVARLPVKLQ
ncbi:MAG TPA: hypothetical protein VHR64_07750 [Thermomicrobiales bacterium]|nr:hypothetical protein [Thermomicrobiales bacterium]